MNVTQLIEDLKRDEGIRYSPYKDSLGNWTIGVGHLLGATARMTLVTAGEVDALLSADIASATEYVRTLVSGFDELNDARQRALANMAFNLGPRLAGFVHFLAAVNAAQWDEAANHMMLSLWAKQVGSRAIRLHDLILSDA